MSKKIISLILFFFLIISTTSFNNDIILQNLSKLTLREKVGQLFVVCPDAIDPDLSLIDVNSGKKGIKKITREMKNYYKKYPAGGFIIFDKNLESKEQLIKLNEDLHSLGKVKSFIYVDEEGGRVARIANNKNFDVQKFDPMYTVAKENDESKVFNVGNTIGKYLFELGFDVDFAPDADIFYPEGNNVIGNRAFSEDPETTGTMAVKMLKGLKKNNILGCFKHYPGHGPCLSDTHFSFGVIEKSWDELLKSDLIPFKKGIEEDVPYIMVSHINYPNITDDDLPASLSYKLLTEKLREELGFEGIIITDGMSMGAIHNKYDDETSSVMAILAGVDIILAPYAYEDAFKSVIRAVISGKITEERLNESVYRILSLKLH